MKEIKRKNSKILTERDCQRNVKYGNARFTKVPLKPLSSRKCGRFCRFPHSNRAYFKLLSPLLLLGKKYGSYFTEKPQIKIICLKKQKHGYLNHTLSDKAFRSTLVNRALPSLHGWSLKITLTVPLTSNSEHVNPKPRASFHSQHSEPYIIACQLPTFSIKSPIDHPPLYFVFLPNINILK